jgi:predicted transcriptional regulator of viral defense system
VRFDSILETLSRSRKNVFTVYDAAKLMGKSTAYASLMLSKSKKVKRIEKGKYFIVGANIYEITSNIIFPSYVSLYAGLQYYSLIDQNILKYSIFTIKRHRKISINGNAVEFIKVKKSLFFGYENKANVYVASPEKLFIDCLYFNKPEFASLKDMLNTAINDGLVNTSLLKNYAIKVGSKVVVNKLGFMLESNNIDASELLSFRYSNYVKVKDKEIKEKNSKWRIKND